MLNGTTSIGRRFWLIFRFLVFAGGGFWLLLLASITLFMRLAENRSVIDVHPLLAGTLILLACISIIFGAGYWGRWLYLPVLALSPVVFAVTVYGLARLVPDTGKESGAILMLVAFFVSFAGLWPVDRYYQRRADQPCPDATDADMTYVKQSQHTPQ